MSEIILDMIFRDGLLLPSDINRSHGKLIGSNGCSLVYVWFLANSASDNQVVMTL